MIGALAALVLLQGFTTGQWGIAALAVLICSIAWTKPLLRHGIGSFALGGAGMAAGSWGDALLGLGASCHDAGLWSLSTLGMVSGCTLACVFVCRLGGASGLNPGFHALTLVGMFAGEQTLGVGVVLLGATPGHWTLTVGMAGGAAIGAWTAGLMTGVTTR